MKGSGTRNSLRTGDRLGVPAKVISYSAGSGDEIHAYFARLALEEPVSAVVAVHHVPGFDAIADLWGGGVVMAEDELSETRSVAPIDYTARLTAPLLRLFGNDDTHRSPEQVKLHEAQLKRYGEMYEFHRYDGAGHGFFYCHTPKYRPEAAMDGWEKVFSFFGRHLKS